MEYLKLNKIPCRRKIDINMSLTKLKYILYDARFIKSVEILNNNDKNKAIYMIRLYTNFNLSLAKKYIYNLDKFKKKMTNPLQY
jgi:hypothetical protein